MKRRLMLLAAILCLTAMAGAQTIYENGPVSGVNQEPRFDHSNSVSNTFTVSGGNSTVTGVSIWIMIGIADHNPGAEVIISSGQNGGGTVYFDRTVQFSNETNCYANLWGYNNCQETTNWTGGPTLPNGSYWVTLRHGTVPSGSDFGWDENAGFDCQSQGCPSQAYQQFVGTIPSEAFTILGTTGGDASSSPKTTSLLMFGAAFFGMVRIVRNKIG